MNEKQLFEAIIGALPYSKPFLFVDRILSINTEGITGLYKFPENSPVYDGHFKDNKIIPGAILLETMAQTGGVCLGIYLSDYHLNNTSNLPLLSTIEADFFKTVRPGETVTIKSEKIYFRKDILKCSIELINENDELIARSKMICNFCIL